MNATFAGPSMAIAAAIVAAMLAWLTIRLLVFARQRKREEPETQAGPTWHLSGWGMWSLVDDSDRIIGSVARDFGTYYASNEVTHLGMFVDLDRAKRAVERSVMIFVAAPTPQGSDTK